MSKQIVLRADRRIEVGQVDPGALGVYCHATMLTSFPGSLRSCPPGQLPRVASLLPAGPASPGR
jgi:hypothetical protein